MKSSRQIAKHFKEVFFGGNWTAVNFKDNLENISWQQATKKIESFNTIAILTFHIGYYVSAVSKVLEGGELVAKDELSFSHSPINSQEDWDGLVSKILVDAEKMANLIGQLEEQRLWGNFTDEKYGIYYRNLLGIIEHTHYHLGQISLIKKLVLKVGKD
ncbi:MAG: DUF1572 domain-containing protein [Flavobacteriales bacterium]|nr:MAG: DUF1572 domain-containing protein [Flavobacteriales bacterium]